MTFSKSFICVREIAKSAKCLLHKHEDLNLSPRAQRGKGGTVRSACMQSHCSGDKNRPVSEAHGLASLPLELQASKKACLKDKNMDSAWEMILVVLQ